MEGGEGLAFCGGEGGVILVTGEADVLAGPFVEGGEVGVWWEVRDTEEVIVGGNPIVLWGLFCVLK